jgi:hypothetical protein
MNRERRVTVRRTVLPAILVAGLSSIALLLSSCYLFVGGPADLMPLPDVVEVLDLPQILSCSASPIRTTCENLYERVCGWYFWTAPGVQTPATGWIYDCRDVWRGTACLYDITIRLTVSDPSDDLDPSKSPRVRVFDSEPAPGGSTFRDCLLDVPRTDIVILSTDVAGSGSTKTVSVRLRDVRARFAANCGTFSASLRFAIVFEADGEELSSTNTREAVVECNRP